MNAFLLQHGFERQAAADPQRVALADSDAAATAVSYGELERASRALAVRLRGLGLEPGARVGVWMTKSAAAVIALLASLRAGAVYVPCDPQAPPARVARMLADAGARFLLAEPGRRELLGEAWQGIALAETPGDSWLHASDAPALAPPPLTGADLAYILYTSGSTGVPKGVALSHAHGLNFIAWAGAEFSLTAADRMVSHAPFHFDLSIFDLWAGLSAGAQVCLLDRLTATFPAALAAWIDSRRISVWYSVPSAMQNLLPALATPGIGGLRCVLFAGEPMPAPVLAAWRARLPQATFANLYGPTETNVCAFYRVPAWPAPVPEPLPIGNACPNFELEILDDDGQPAGADALGDLWARGPGLFAGYWGDGERTAASEMWRGTIGQPGAQRLYNTGDRARRGSDGLLYFHGRRDDMVKCRGYRIALGEIQAALLACPGVRQAAVLALPTHRAPEWLHAVVAGEDGLEAATLRAACAARLPPYMLPAQIEVRPGLPETSTGKIDRERLLAEIEARVPAAASAPGGAHA